ncbi:MAG: hypothetical protein HRT90_02075 [Candidatus Margulisbacteria bacterium]|nr:hypothetical protein [Candidatus Margulisiibacteriota bacterium]
MKNILEQFLAKGSKTFSVNDVLPYKQQNRSAVLQSIARAEKSGDVMSIAKGFYVICSPSEKINQSISPTKYISQLMKRLKLDYYVGLLSAASFYGCTHHRPIEFQVITFPQNRIKNKHLWNVHFYTSSEIVSRQKCSLIRKEAGEFEFINYSTQIVTGYDLVKFEKASGGMYNVILVLKELLSQIEINHVNKLVLGEVEISSIQRLGFLMDKLGYHDLTGPLLKGQVKARFLEKILLSTLEKKQDNNESRKANVWKIEDNIDWENIDVT